MARHGAGARRRGEAAPRGRDDRGGRVHGRGTGAPPPRPVPARRRIKADRTPSTASVPVRGRAVPDGRARAPVARLPVEVGRPVGRPSLGTRLGTRPAPIIALPPPRGLGRGDGGVRGTGRGRPRRGRRAGGRGGGARGSGWGRHDHCFSPRLSLSLPDVSKFDGCCAGFAPRRGGLSHPHPDQCRCSRPFFPFLTPAPPQNLGPFFKMTTGTTGARSGGEPSRL
mmetsp:Transcript_12101/g.26299  ORF Transcript_12101/g.26299 Transcript_12101/m.26299 type:complete len:225 (+) Transcript_12101:710-1384(+)